MKEQEIDQFVLRSDRHSPYFRLAFADDQVTFNTSTLSVRMAKAKFDPALGWHAASSHAAEGLPLPSHIYQSSLLRANAFLLCQDHPDYRVAVAASLNTPGTKAVRNVLRALLFCRDTSLETVAALSHYDVHVVKLFHDLFWSVKDRLDEPGFVAQILYPQTRFPSQSARKQEEADSGLRLVRLGYERGYRAVLRAAGWDALVDHKVTPGMLMAQIKSSALSRGAIEIEMGLDSSVLDQAMGLVLLEEKRQAEHPIDQDSRRGLAGMSMSMAVNESFMRIMRPDLERRLALQRGLEVEKQTAPPRVAGVNL